MMNDTDLPIPTPLMVALYARKMLENENGGTKDKSTPSILKSSKPTKAKPAAQQSQKQIPSVNIRATHSTPVLHSTPSNSSLSSEKRRSSKKSQTPKFTEYWTNDDVTDGLKSGALIRGVIRINQRNFEEAYVSDPSGGEDFVLIGTKARNRAFPGDVVAIKQKARYQWLVRDTFEDDTAPINTTPTNPNTPQKRQYRTIADCSAEVPDEFVMRTAEVVHVLERRHSRIGVGLLKPSQLTDFILFSPIDSRIPRALIPKFDAPKGFVERPQDFVSVLFAGQFRDTEWPVIDTFPKASLIKRLGNAGDIEPEIEGILLQNNIDTNDFPIECIQGLPDCDETGHFVIPPSELAKRRDLRSERLFTIDPSTARDLDDALHIKRLDNGLLEVGVHIADVSYFIDHGSQLDLIAQKRATSVYLVHRVISMLPRQLCEQLCSLNSGVDRLAMSVIWQMDDFGNIEDEWFGKTVIRSVCKLSYDHAQEFIVNPEKSFESHDFPPISAGHSVADVANSVCQLDTLARRLRAKRFENGSLRIDQPKLSFTFDDLDEYPTGCTVYQRKDSNSLIEEFMLLANMATAHRIHRFYPDIALLRRHPPPNERQLKEAIKVCGRFGIDMMGANSKELHQSLSSLVQSRENQHLAPVVTQLLMKSMQLAIYFCAGVIEDELQYRHYALNIPLYTHFTSPIRRYPDIMVHRLLAASLELDNEKDPGQTSLDVERIAQHCNERKVAARIVSDFSAELFFAAFVEKCGPLEEKSVVVQVQDHSFDVLVVKYAITKRVYTDKLNLVGKPTFQKGPPAVLKLTVKRAENIETEMTITIGHQLDVLLKVNSERKNQLIAALPDY